ncbi:alpha/beta hydrolase [Pedobacter sp. R-06]|uniref:alpha/beta hydrolase n=1 Tax=Pedobacter sp. R-06 TaxID=3404051 RepID=UPI003CEE6183
MDAIQSNYLTAGQPIESATGVLIMIHGRGGNALDIMALSDELQIGGMAVFAPQALQNSWYPHSFMAPIATNQPSVNLSLGMVGELVKHALNYGIARERIFFLGFSQGACVMLEYISRNAGKYGGAIAFTGGLIGEVLVDDNYKGDFLGTRVLITTGNMDPHVPLKRVKETVAQLELLQANVRLEIYKNKPHTILPNEISTANDWIFSYNQV